MPAKPNSLERRNPLPPGRYWVTINPIDFPAFIEWKDSTRRIRVEASELHQEGAQQFEFNVFRILEPGEVAWPIQFGFPSVATENVTSLSDVVRVPDIDEPDPRDVADKLIDFGKVALGVAALIALAKIFGGRK